MIYEISNLDFSYSKEKSVLSNINLTLDNGELLVVLGKNGVGKSTLFSLMLGLIKSEEGKILLDGKDINSLREKDIASLVSFVPQATNPTFNITVFDYVLMGCASKVGIFSKPKEKEIKSAYDALESLDILDFKDRSMFTLSGGERQIVTIARALCSNPKAILFDEPIAHLDYQNQIKVLKMIKDLSLKGYAIAITTHDINHALILNSNIAIIDDMGHLTKGKIDDLLTEDNLKKVYDSDLKVRYLDEFKRNVLIYPSI